jgi:phosphoribosylformylglycinamidine cyclo-ligase
VGDVAIGLSSQGVHSNGFSLVRKIIETSGQSLTDRPEILGGKTLGEELLTPTQIYVKPVLAALRSGLEIHGMAHITGGGLPENLPRCLGANQSVQVDSQSWTVPPIFAWLAAQGQVDRLEMFNTFNMGIGFIVLVSPNQVDRTLEHFQTQQVVAWTIGEVVSGTGELLLK